MLYGRRKGVEKDSICATGRRIYLRKGEKILALPLRLWARQKEAGLETWKTDEVVDGKTLSLLSEMVDVGHLLEEWQCGRSRVTWDGWGREHTAHPQRINQRRCSLFAKVIQNRSGQFLSYGFILLSLEFGNIYEHSRELLTFDLKHHRQFMYITV